MYRWGDKLPSDPDSSFVDMDSAPFVGQGVPVRSSSTVGVPSTMIAVAYRQGMIASRPTVLEVPSRKVATPVVKYQPGLATITVPGTPGSIVNYQFAKSAGDNELDRRHRWQSALPDLETGVVRVTVDSNQPGELLLLVYASRVGYHKSDLLQIPIKIEVAPQPSVTFNAAKGTVTMRTELFRGGNFAYSYVSAAGVESSGEAPGPTFTLHLGIGDLASSCAVYGSVFGPGYAASKIVRWKAPPGWNPAVNSLQTSGRPVQPSSPLPASSGVPPLATGNEAIVVTIQVPTAETLGVGIVHKNGQNFVHGCAPGGNADRSRKLCAGDRLVTVNTTDVSTVSREDCIAAVKDATAAGTVSLTIVQVNPSAVAAPVSPSSAVITDRTSAAEMSTMSIKVMLKKGQLLGIGILHEHGQNFVRGTAAGGLCVGDRILKVNKTDVSNVSKEECIAAVEAATKKVVFVIMRPNNASTTAPLEKTKRRRFQGMQTRRTQMEGGATGASALNSIAFGTLVAKTVDPAGNDTGAADEDNSKPTNNIYDAGVPSPKKPKSKRTGGGLGKIVAAISVPAGEGIGIGVQHDDETNSNIVSGMKSGGNAEQCGLIERGDRFIRINGTHVATSSREECIAALKAAAAASTTVKLTLRRPPQPTEVSPAPPAPPVGNSVLDAIAFGNLPTLKTRSRKKPGTTPPVEDSSPSDDIYGGAEC